MWFDELMDDCKQALSLIWSNPWIALPYILHTLIVGIISIGLVVVFFFMFIVGAVGTASFTDFPLWGMLVPIIVTLALISLVFSALTAMVDAGSISMFALVAEGHKPSSAMFWDGLRRHFMSMWGIRLFLGGILLVLSPLLVLLVLLYAMTVGILSAGWGFVIIPVLTMVYFSAWPMALILDNQGGFKALGAGIRLGRRYFWGMFILGLAATLIGQQMSSALGPLLTLIVGWVIAVLVKSWSQMAVLLIYKRRR